MKLSAFHLVLELLLQHKRLSQLYQSILQILNILLERVHVGLVYQGTQFFKCLWFHIELLWLFNWLLLESIIQWLVVLLDTRHCFLKIGFLPSLEVSLGFEPNDFALALNFIDDKIRESVLDRAIE